MATIAMIISRMPLEAWIRRKLSKGRTRASAACRAGAQAQGGASEIIVRGCLADVCATGTSGELVLLCCSLMALPGVGRAGRRGGRTARRGAVRRAPLTLKTRPREENPQALRFDSLVETSL